VSRDVVSVWLIALAAGVVPLARASAQVALNHLYVYLDSASYHGLAGSGFVRDSFATVRQATISDTRTSWSGLYLFGRTTYLEIFQAGPMTPPSGTVALAFGVDRAGDLDAVAEQLRLAGRPAVGYIRRRAVGTDTIPWFRELSSGAGDSALVGPLVRWWVMEYDAAYLARRPGGEMTPGSGVDRARYNRPLFRPDLLMRDVARVALRLPDSVRLALAGQLRALGLAADRAGDTVRFRADSVLVDLLPGAEGSNGLREIQFTIRPGQNYSRRRLGGATLTVGGARARLVLDTLDSP
jgi:hypothetical protein